MANNKCIFFLDVGRAWRPSENSIQSLMVSYCSVIKIIFTPDVGDGYVELSLDSHRVRVHAARKGS